MCVDTSSITNLAAMATYDGSEAGGEDSYFPSELLNDEEKGDFVASFIPPVNWGNVQTV